jgi:hypothetical protein
LGLRGAVLHEFARGVEGASVMKIEDVSSFVASERARKNSPELCTPKEDVFTLDDHALAESLRLGEKAITLT